MIISASRRTDLPALYAEWLHARFRAGSCLVANPMNPRQVARVSLARCDVDAIVFWTRHAPPSFPLLAWLDAHGYRYYFQYTITGYGPPLEGSAPPLEVALRSFRRLSARLPVGAVVWRYDPIVLGGRFTTASHLARFGRIASALEGAARRVIVSFLDPYAKTRRRLGSLGIANLGGDASVGGEGTTLLAELAEIARRHGMDVRCCAEDVDYSALGIERARCIDNELLTELFGGEWPTRKDPGQRPRCRCIPSKDIGVADTCTFDCRYCYSTRSTELARRRRRSHARDGEALWLPSPAAAPPPSAA